MTISEIENNLEKIILNFNKETFVFDLLMSYDIKKSTVKRLQDSEHNKLNINGELILRKKLFFKVPTIDIHVEIDNLIKDPYTLKHNPRFIVVTDYETILAYDTKTDDYLDILLVDLPNHNTFFLPWAGMEKNQVEDENPADIKAAEKMGKLYDEILENNHFETDEELHSLNVFLTRLLFCYFAEDTGIYKDNLFTNSISSYTTKDGSDLNEFLEKVFDIFNLKSRPDNTPQYLKDFPYVNGGLFRDRLPIPEFTAKSRKVMIEIGELGWSEINPDIFGSMIQAVVKTEHRGTMGMHYTSVPNIMKIIEPLFLDELYEEFERGFDSKIILQNILKRISNIKLFDPACGSGNFLIIAYKKLRELEITILKRIDILNKQTSKPIQATFAFSEIKLTSFFGIEFDDFAHEVAILSLWLAEHQMNIKFYEEFGRTLPSLPLQNGGNITYGNANRLNWEEVCPKNEGDEIYILGNPPYLGSSMQEKFQKEDMDIVFSSELKSYRNLDYISCWFFKAANYARDFNCEFAFVSTNSITQGEQVGLLWPYILNSLEISFGIQSFPWSNNAKAKAAVIVVIIGIRNISKKQKMLIKDGYTKYVDNINPYLTANNSSYILRRSSPISSFLPMMKGNYATDDGNLILDEDEKNYLLENYPESKLFIKKYIGSQEFIKGIDRWCLWIRDENLGIANSIPEVKERIEKVSMFRSKSKAPSTREKEKIGHKFIQIQSEPRDALIVPSVSSIRREYIPVGFVDDITVVNAQCLVIYNPDNYLFGIITSRMHMVWVRAVAGRLKSDYRYSSALCYYGFPFPEITKSKKEEIEELVFEILDERENYPEKTMSQLYDPDTMPKTLKDLHNNLDLLIEKCYRNKPFINDENRLEYLFKLYEEMTTNER
ncbi:class I SAM-dependent DNA methyltransferase [Arcobacter peruensis]|uniref:class I SAM-dependent DNA methyltransferase n=1 Tax=Arcobacter peruensis TaxID=2320140 RepID=UPI000F07A51B|nr:DNA methyltransferase [Arcobacter peruensis]